MPGFAIALGVLAGMLDAFSVGRYPTGTADLLNVLTAKLLNHRADVSPPSRA
jgi:hypothetical protein